MTRPNTEEVKIPYQDYLDYVETALTSIIGRFPEKGDIEDGLRKIALAAQPAVFLREKFVETGGSVDTISLRGKCSFAVKEESIPSKHFDINLKTVVPTVPRTPALKLMYHPAKGVFFTTNGRC